MMSKRIWYLSPYAVDVNIGREYNAQIAQLPADDYVCILDQDVMFLHPKTKRQIQHIVEAHPEYSLLTCVTNRLGFGWQLHEGKRSDERDPLVHYQIAMQRRVNHYHAVYDFPHPVAGFFMLFPVAQWRKTPFQEGSPYFDFAFTEDVRGSGGKVGIMAGVYVYHFYRMFATGNPHLFTEHLNP